MSKLDEISKPFGPMFAKRFCIMTGIKTLYML
jgi:hypothetical protein